MWGKPKGVPAWAVVKARLRFQGLLIASVAGNPWKRRGAGGKVLKVDLGVV